MRGSHHSLNPCSAGRCSLTSIPQQKLPSGRRLNPCSAGRCSLTSGEKRVIDRAYGLNPCSAGRCSLTEINDFIESWDEKS